ncbi:MAG: tetratricopeptide repeat protein [Oscillospiraceae bacterium]|jgi:tetratricopeptide (TPR) repeat protein|nr:tetratricopeptide repeat protein [Oscillospiraceae bacterium]
MSFFGNAAGQRALLEHQKGNYGKAEQMYEAALQKGADKAGILIGYAVLLTRVGKYEKSVELLRNAEKARDVSKEQKSQIVLHYAVAQYKLGNIAKAVELCRELFRTRKTGLLYDTLGYLLIEAGDYEEALAFNREAVEYDDEDAVALDNLAQTYLRLGNDPDSARIWFEKARAVKPDQIDTLYFLAQYDQKNGDLDAAREKLEHAAEGRFSPLNYATKERVLEALQALGAGRRDSGKVVNKSE